MVELRILTSSKDCIDVEVFSSLDKFISYVGYPFEEIIRNIDVVDENSNVYFLYIQNETIYYTNSRLSVDLEKNISERVFTYIKTFGSYDSEEEKWKIPQLIDEIVKLRGLTY